VGGEVCLAPLRSTYKHNDDLCDDEAGEPDFPPRHNSQVGSAMMNYVFHLFTLL